MKIIATDRAREVVATMGQRRQGLLSVTIGTGCCESTAPFLYEDFWPGPDQAVVGEVAGVSIYAPLYLRAMYADDHELALDVIDELAESLSIETELGCRLVLRGVGDDANRQESCQVTAPPEAAQRPVVGQLLEALRGLLMR